MAGFSKRNYKDSVSSKARTPLSVVIIALNEAKQLPACLESVQFADEVVLVDSGSTDATPTIAQEFGARVIVEPWRGYGRQKQFAVEQATHDFVLCIDADERVSPRLREAIGAALNGAPTGAAYRFRRCNRFMGRYLRHGEGYPDWVLRLFDRRVAAWSDDSVHERVQFSGAVRELSGDLIHDSAENLTKYLEKQNKYAAIAADKALASGGKRILVLRMLFSPMVRFVKFYIVRLGFLDGLAGFVHISIGCFYSFIKYAKMAGKSSS